jgi:hypothetical protein
MDRNGYLVRMTVNGVKIRKVIIDPHYKKKHSASITDDIFLELVKTLDGKYFDADDEKNPFLYFVTDKIGYNGKYYKLIWLLENREMYVGVINAYRR